MYKKEIYLEIDTNLHQPIQSMEADSNSRAIRFYLTSNYTPLNLTGKKVIFKAVKPDGTDIVNDCEIIDVGKGIVEIEVTKQLNAIPGKVNCQLSVLGANDYVLKTKKFVISVDSKLTESGVVSSKEYKTLENALSQVHEINKNFEQVNAKINEVATKGTTVEVIEEATKEEIERQIADGTITHLMIEDGSVTPEKTSFYDEIATQKNLLKNAEFDYMGNNQNTVKKAIDSSIDWVLGEVNTAHYEGQHITATDTIEGHAKSAILKGQTLVNLINDGEVTKNATNNWVVFSADFNADMIKTSTDYTLITYVISNTLSDGSGCAFGVSGRLNDGFGFKSISVPSGKVGVYKIKLTTKNVFSQPPALRQQIFNDVATGSITFKQVLVEGDYTNVDVPYFEGMQSVKLPVLTTTGKNLINLGDFSEQTKNGITLSRNNNSSIKLNGETSSMTNFWFNDLSIKLKPDTYQFLLSHQDNNITYFFRDVDGNNVIATKFSNSVVITEDKTIKSLLIQVNGGVNSSNQDINIQLESGGSVATPYEPYKSNILTVNEPVELRGIGDVKDELNLMTGEVIQKIQEFTLDGYNIHEDYWYTSTSQYAGTETYYISTRYLDDKLKPHGRVISNLLPEGETWNTDYECVDIQGATNGYMLRFRVNKTKLSELSINGFIEFLKQNPITIYYELATKSVKTVDLSGDAVYSYNEVTHYDCSSEEGSLVPILSVDVPTNLSALVSRQRATIETQKEQIQTLEIENEQLIEQNQAQDEDIALNQDAINFMLFASEMLADDNNKTKGANTMAAYLANQILKGKLDYSLVVSRYPQFKEDIDTILILEGEENLIK